MVKFWVLPGVIPLLVGLSAFAADGTEKFNELVLKLHLKGVEEGLKKSAEEANRKAPFAIDNMTIFFKARSGWPNLYLLRQS